MASSQSGRPPEFHAKRALDLLGYPADAKLLIIHADDLGMCRSVNAAIFKALDEQSISSASAMVPCPCFGEDRSHGWRSVDRQQVHDHGRFAFVLRNLAHAQPVRSPDYPGYALDCDGQRVAAGVVRLVVERGYGTLSGNRKD